MSNHDNDIQEAGVLIGKIQESMRFILLAAVMKGDAFRSMKALNALSADMIERAESNEIEVRQMIDLVNEFERLVRAGLGVKAAADKLIKDGWMNTVGHHALDRMGV